MKLAQAKWNRKRTEFEYPFNKLDCPLVLAKQIPLQSLDRLDKIYKEVLQQEGEGLC